MNSKYEVVIGLEVHAQLQTKTKLFCGDDISFGAEANTHISAITLGHPGTLPKTNEKAVEYAIKLGLACNCTIEEKNYFARKNYFYPDLPKGYQISQHTTPICKGGFVTIILNGQPTNIQLNRIHIEEDAGKSIHDLYDNKTCIDLNRAGTALLEIVTEPCIHSSEAAFLYVTELRKLVRWIEVCDGNMEEGSLRCDANISIRLKGETKLGTKVEIKNLNSIRNIKRAIDVEVERMIALVESGGKVVQQTRGYDPNTNTTAAIREKEDANDYRYFADPDLAPFCLTTDFIKNIEKQIPALPAKLINEYQTKYGLNEYDATQLCDDKATANYFEATIKHSNNFKAVANFIIGPLRSYCNDNQKDFENINLKPTQLAGLVALVDDGKVNFGVASTKILPLLYNNEIAPLRIAEQHNLLQTNDDSALENWVNTVLNNMPDKVSEYKKGKKGLIGLFVGEVKKLSAGKANPQTVTKLLQEKLQ